jgi:hypothetical protein
MTLFILQSSLQGLFLQKIPAECSYNNILAEKSFLPAEQGLPFPVLTVQAAACESIAEMQLHLLLLFLQCTGWHSW